MTFIAQTIDVVVSDLAANVATLGLLRHAWLADSDVDDPMGVCDWIRRRVLDACRSGSVAAGTTPTRVRLWHRGIVYIISVGKHHIRVWFVHTMSAADAGYLPGSSTQSAAHMWPWRDAAQAEASA